MKKNNGVIMSEEICYSNYQFQGQVYSPAFSNPPSPSSPMSTTSDTASSSHQPDIYCGEEQPVVQSSPSKTAINNLPTDMTPTYNAKTVSSNSDDQAHKVRLDNGSSISSSNCVALESMNNQNYSNKFEESHNFKKLPSQHNSNSLQGSSTKLRYPTKYHEMLQPLSPVTTLPVEEVVRRPLPNKTHQVDHDIHLQKRFHSLVDTATSSLSKSTTTTTIDNEKTFLNRVNDIEDFLLQHSENVDVNQYNSDGKTALQQSCLAGNLPLVKLLVRFGANMRLTTREGFSILHIAAFSGHSDLLTFVMGQQHNGR